MSPLTHFHHIFRSPATASAPSSVPPSAGSPGALASLLGLGVGSSVKLLVLGSLVETGRRLFRWFLERFRIQYCTTLRFNAGDPAYEWVILFLACRSTTLPHRSLIAAHSTQQTQENIWRRSRDFVVSAQNSQRKWSVPSNPTTSSSTAVGANAEFVPTFSQPQLFRWRGHWVEVARTGPGGHQGGGFGSSTAQAVFPGHTTTVMFGDAVQSGEIHITMYTLDMSLINEFVEEARVIYVEVNKPHVVVHLTNSRYAGHPSRTWTTVKHKMQRSLDSVILPPGRLESLMEDVRGFLGTEMLQWYIDAGIPHRRGYLLYGPPGTGKIHSIHDICTGRSSKPRDIFTLARVVLVRLSDLHGYHPSESFLSVDDSFLERAAAAIPKNGIFLIEDIDCAFPSRNTSDAEAASAAASEMRLGVPFGIHARTQLSVTLSGLLNVLDGVGSEEGKLFFATTNHIERLDAAFLRPGRIDVKIEYELATGQQAGALFLKFFPPAAFDVGQSATEAIPEVPFATDQAVPEDPTTPIPEPLSMVALAAAFAAEIPDGRFSTAELQGFLQGYRKRPMDAVREVGDWVATAIQEHS
ncbi:unnamed protein product [Mycena citricolor]|uniref:BCS1 N-terminal domain-containing protein n=1 Tax=Mycena citricolor TaxID=2018698 RepID=A0AAD2H9S9_9AGAR|nr:unnamed protein product [Mycena citricolor]